MIGQQAEDLYGFTSPGGFVFGVSGWTWGEPRPKTITFYLDNTARVSDQYGRPIKGVVGHDNKPILFAPTGPESDGNNNYRPRPQYATHRQVIAALAAERCDWTTLTSAGFPQLPYDELKQIPALPPTPIEELRKIRDPRLRKDALRARREADEARAREVEAELGE